MPERGASIVMEQYVLGSLLGAGGMGRVYAADHPDRSRVAIKVLHETLAADATMIARLFDEAAAAKRITHRNVVRIYEWRLTSEGVPFIAMERVDGIPLGLLIQRQGPLSLVRLRNIASQILSGLAAIHRGKLVHGDMKSDNILVDANDRVTIVDFGLARAPATQPIGADRQMLSGTPEYMAPELIRGDVITPAADIYAVGVIIYEMLTGSTPFSGGTAMEIFDRHLVEAVVRPSLRCPERRMPVSLETAILRALEKDPAARHLNAALFATAVERSIPSNVVDDEIPLPGAHAPNTPTDEWSGAPTSRRLPHPRQRFSSRTAPRDSTRVGTCRKEVEAAIAQGDAELVMIAVLGMVRALVDEHRLLGAVQELETVISWVSSRPHHAEGLNRLRRTLAAIYNGLDYPDRSRSMRRLGKRHHVR